MSQIIEKFTQRLYDDWLPSFCGAPHRNYSSAGFKESSIKKLREYDAHWFMRAVDSQLVRESDGFFMAPRSMAKEQIFWQGAKNKNPRPVTLWVEPVITIGALARLNEQYGWPASNLGAQSKTWAFDLVCYETSSAGELICCEVKKQPAEISELLKYMHAHSTEPVQEHEPTDAKERNAYRKVQGIRSSWPSYFWALGPSGKGQAFQVQREHESQNFSLIACSEELLRYAGA